MAVTRVALEATEQVARDANVAKNVIQVVLDKYKCLIVGNVNSVIWQAIAQYRSFKETVLLNHEVSLEMTDIIF